LRKGSLGKVYQSGDFIIKQGDEDDSMYVVQEGEVEVLREMGSKEIRLEILGVGDFFGEVPFFERKADSGAVRASVRALKQTRVLTLDKKIVVRRLHEDPSLAIRILQVMSRRIREMENEVARLIVNG